MIWKEVCFIGIFGLVMVAVVYIILGRDDPGRKQPIDKAPSFCEQYFEDLDLECRSITIDSNLVCYCELDF